MLICLTCAGDIGVRLAQALLVSMLSCTCARDIMRVLCTMEPDEAVQVFVTALRALEELGDSISADAKRTWQQEMVGVVASTLR